MRWREKKKRGSKSGRERERVDVSTHRWKKDVTCDSKIDLHKKLVFEMIHEEKEIMPGHDISSTPFSHIYK